MDENNINLVKLRGANYFRIKIAYSLLLQKTIDISDIRSESINPGLTEYEISFLKLIEKVTNGTKIEISRTGTRLRFYPGVITNNYGELFEYTCDSSRGLTYYLEGLVPICMFGKESLNVILKGVTNDNRDISCDTFKNVTCGLIQKMVYGDKVEFDIQNRGVVPDGVGQIKFKCPIVLFLNNFDWIDEGKIKRIRGLAFTCRVPGSFNTRMIDASRGVFNNFIPDVWIATDSSKNKNKEEVSQGYGISVYGETTNEFLFSTDITNDGEGNKSLTPEELARKCCLQFLNEIYNSGAVDSHHLPLFLFMMAISTNNMVSSLKVGKINNKVKSLLRLIYQLIGVKFKITPCEEDDYDQEVNEEEEEVDFDNDNFDDEQDLDYGKIDNNTEAIDKYIFACIGLGLKNVSRIEA